jgi:hypothetical protein
MSLFVLGVLLATAQTNPPAAPKAKPPATRASGKATPSTTPVVLPRVEAGGVSVTYRRLPWNPRMFGVAQRGSSAPEVVVDGQTVPAGAYQFDVSLAKVDTQVPVALYGARLDPGSYVLVIQPKRQGREMGLQWRRVAPETKLRPGQFTQIPDGPVVLERPAAWEPGPETTTVMKASLDAVAGGLRLIFDYGDRRLTLDLRL